MTYVVYTDGEAKVTVKNRLQKLPRTIWGMDDDPADAMGDALSWLPTDGSENIYIQYFRVAKVDDSTADLIEENEDVGNMRFVIRDGNLILGDENEDLG